MCGIFFCINFGNSVCSVDEKLHRLLLNRGPDSFATLQHGNLFFAGYVLYQQGEICKQPFEDDNIILLFNGDIFNIEHSKPNSTSDTTWLGNCFSRNSKTENGILDVFKKLEGPYSIVLYNKNTESIYIARDPLGRNSLLIENNEHSLCIMSTSYIPTKRTDSKTMELPSLGVYKLKPKKSDKLSLFPWSDLTSSDLEEQLLNHISLSNVVESSAVKPIWLAPLELNKSTFNFYEMCETLSSSDADVLYKNLLENEHLLMELSKFSALLSNSVRDRVQKTTKHCAKCNDEFCQHSKIAILFSGGIDCSILAVLADKYVDMKDSIDLINFACENKNLTVDKYDVPDRISAKESFAELKKLCPSRKWNFIEVNATRDECNEHLKNHIKHLIFPLNTVLDESLGVAFWFAARGDGTLDGMPYKSTARVAIIGSGADELFGGYKRHKNAYTRCAGSYAEKILAVRMELEKDWSRIAARNLARDDRVVGDTSKTLRAPFIEENIVQYVRSLKTDQLCCYNLDDGLGDKLFLRLFGYTLGLRASPFLKKRAIQFGSKIANKKQNAKDISQFLL